MFFIRKFSPTRALEWRDRTLNSEEEENGQAVFLEILTNPFHAPETVPVLDEDIQESGTDTAVYVLSRNSGEGKDRRDVSGDYELSDEEKAAIQKLAVSYSKFIVVLNVGGVIDTKFLRNTEGIGAILLMSQAGNIGGYALADVLTGKAVPSGHLTATWAENYRDYPGADSFSFHNGDLDDEYYQEGIYVGYRYFDTFGIKPAYPFGYGKSYTDFAVDVEGVKADAKQVEVTVKVTNIGAFYGGKEVVQPCTISENNSTGGNNHLGYFICRNLLYSFWISCSSCIPIAYKKV